jgi:N-acetyl-gamma-glutamylphosphate reductase
MHNTQIVTTTAILGSAGYTGQETLDRVLAHPGLELVALGSETLAGRPAHALHPGLNGNLPMFTPNLEAAGSGAELIFLCLGNAEAAVFTPPEDAVVVDLTGAPPATPPADLAG